MRTGTTDSSVRDMLAALVRDNPDPALGPKMEKAIAMFKKERNLLYIDLEPSARALRAVIKSQSHPDDLEYAVYIDHAGHFFCTTQNLRPCGGLRGQICKHVLLALVAAAKSGDGDARELSRWVSSTSATKPVLDKNEATQIFMKYKDALSGILAWRPVELLPEDFMAF
ncbi:MAG: hypothetical protein GYA24_09270 [Candidatus Lokiarchaeota archaeon]|nr:hypothetical protein [Candidatus Lokiarchaeota archaeon]